MGTNSILSSAYVFSTFHYDAEVWDGIAMRRLNSEAEVQDLWYYLVCPLSNQ